MFGIFRLKGKGLACAFILWAWVGIAATVAAGESTSRQNPPNLAGTAWRLVEFQSMDDATGTVRPETSSLYTMHLHSTESMRNRFFGTQTT